MPAWVDSGWEAMGGGPADLVFPPEFLGVWDVTSVLARVETPLGEDAVPNTESLKRAREEDLNRALQYRVAFVKNPSGRVVHDRRYNTAQLLAMYYEGGAPALQNSIAWDIRDPNVLTLGMPGMSVRTRVTRRSEAFPQPDKIETSEFVEVIYDSGGPSRIKASQCFTKYKWRSEAAAQQDGGPVIVATQVVSDQLTPFDGEQRYLMARGQPYAVYSYRLSFRRAPPGA